MKRWGNGVMARLVSRLTGQTFHDVSCGMRCYSRRAAMSLNPIGRFTYTQEVFLNLAFKQLRIAEVPVRRARRTRVRREPRGRQPLALRPQHQRNHLPLLPRLPADALLRIDRRWSLAAGRRRAARLPGRPLPAAPAASRRTSGRASPGRRRSCSRCWCSSSGLIGDMLNRHRIYLEELLYRERERTTRGERAG